MQGKHLARTMYNLFSKKYLTVVLFLGLFYIVWKRNVVKFYPEFQDDMCWRNRSKLEPSLQSYDKSELDYRPATITDTFLIEEKHFCSKRPHLRAIAYVHSTISSVEKRQVTRETWANASDNIGVVFVVGKAKSKLEEEIVTKESRLYGDIVQGNYTDMYRRLVHKALNSLYWVSINCANVQWVMHCDDDVIVDVVKLDNTLDSFEMAERYDEIFCYPFNKSPVRRTGKWNVSYSDIPCKFYPPYCAGPFWFTSMDVVKKLLGGVPFLRYYWLDDVYITGFLAENVRIKKTKADLKIFHYKPEEIGSTIAWLQVDDDKRTIWRQILEYYKKS